MMSNSFVSIGMPVYNGEKHIAQALDSLLSQTYRNFELIISDDASADLTREICLEYASRDNRIKYHRQERNLGITENFNYALIAAEGSYFMWAAQDDWWAPTYLERCLEAMEADPGVVFASSKTILVSPDGTEMGRDDFDFTTVGKTVTGRVRHYLNNVGIYNSLFYGLIRSSALRGKSLAHIMGQDHLIMVELLLEGDIRIVDEYLFRKSIGGGTSSHIRKFAAIYGITDRRQIYWHHAYRFTHYVPVLVHSSRIGMLSKAYLLYSLASVYFRRYFYHDLTSQNIFRRVKKLSYLRSRKHEGGKDTVVSKLLILTCLPVIHIRHFFYRYIRKKNVLSSDR
jgi:glycosyltransferase involved in cell wall biosynthesis